MATDDGYHGGILAWGVDKKPLQSSSTSNYLTKVVQKVTLEGNPLLGRLSTKYGLK
jgi:hypothetical protein